MALLKLSGGITQTLEPGQRYWLICGNEQQMQQRFDACAEALNPLAPGQIGALEGAGGLLSNLRVWENLVLPAWYHHHQSLTQLEVRFQEAFAQLGLEGKALAQLAAALPASLDRERKRQLVLVRAYMQEAKYLLADQEWFGWISQPAPRGCKDLFEGMALSVPLIVVGIGAPDTAWHLQEIVPMPQTEVS